jgi:hypothetical protein
MVSRSCNSSSSSTATLLDLSDEAVLLLAHFLEAPDVLSLLSSHPTLHRNFGRSHAFWRSVKNAHYRSCCSPLTTDTSATEKRLNAAFPGTVESDWNTVKDEYLLQAHCDLLTKVCWHCSQIGVPSAREGHLCCQLGDFVLLTGGFTHDKTVYAKGIHDSCGIWRPLSWANGTQEPEWVYGATLTALDTHRAVRFGGFQSKGYLDQTSQVALLHFDAEHWIVRWEVVMCQQEQYGTVVSEGEENMMWAIMRARAYHSAVLVAKRYLFIVGGMQFSRSILGPLLLDCETWTWCMDVIGTSGSTGAPSPRHGCSVVWDPIRNRLVLFGGGNGADLLRSGSDNTEVWALNTNGFSVSCHNDTEPNVDIHSTLPWQWERLHSDQTGREAADTDRITQPNRLSLAETLNLGRCHGGFRVSRDKVLLFGGGRPTTNGILGYDLARDEFLRPNVCRSFVPRARFSFASVFVESLGYILVHGGFSDQRNARKTLSDSVILDLAPWMHRRHSSPWCCQTKVASFRKVTNQDVMASRVGADVRSVMKPIASTMMQMNAAEGASFLAHVHMRIDGRFTSVLHHILAESVAATESSSMRQANE